MRKTITLYRLSSLCFFALLFSQLPAQQSPVIIKIVNHKNEPVPAASVTVTDHLDSLQQFKQVADSNGLASFQLQKVRQYTISISSVNYQYFEKGFVFSGNQTRFNFTLEPLSKTLAGVVVTSQRPLMRQEDDKTIVDPEALAATSTSAYEILEKTPGLFVDQDGNIYINSLSPSSIQINGRDMKMSTADVATMLKNLPPNSIAKIEIVKTPSAKYDASGTGGIVNVVLKKGVKLGMTGSINGGWQQGVYGNKFLGLNLNNNDGKKTSYLNLSFSRRNNFEQIKTDRLFAPDSLLSQDARTIYPSSTYYGAYGITWEAGKKWELTYDANLNFNDFKNRSTNDNSIRKISTAQLISNSLNKVTKDGNSLFLGTGLESKYKIDTLGSEWTNDIWYTHSINKTNQAFTTDNHTAGIPAMGDGRGTNNRDYINLKSDLKLKMKKKFTLEAGIQSYFNFYHNVTNYFRETGGVRTKDNNRTNTFKYKENINSGYIQGSKTLGEDLVIKFGARVENTNMEGRQIIPGDTSFNIHRTDYFPYIYISRNIMKIAGFDLRAYLVYRRTISRPVYDQLNPFPRYVDQYLTEVGNPALRPQFTQNYEANVSIDERPIIAIGINNTKDIFTNVVYQADSSKEQAYRTYDNVGKNKEWYFRALGAIPPGKKYFFVLGVQYNHNLYNGLYENKPLSFDKGTWTFFTYHSLKLDKLSQMTLFGFMRLKGQQQFYELTSFGNLNASINRQFLNKKLIVTLSMNDIFYTNKNNFKINQGSVNASGFRRSDTRRAGINIRYNFGIRKKEETPDMFNIEQSQ
ncbi:MAG: outer membrane beta-barrel family protein [Chitinophagaceae bacterium]